MFASYDVTGTDVYAGGSAPCPAAHAGGIKFEEGGKVVVKMLDPKKIFNFVGSRRHGVTSLSSVDRHGLYVRFIMSNP